MRSHEIAVAAVIAGGRVLLAHRSPDRRWYPDCWDLIGGHVEAGESPVEAVERECREELAIEIARPRRVEFDFGDPAVVAHVFVVDQWTGDPTNAAPEEHDALAWFDARDLTGLPLAHPGYAAWLADLSTPTGER